MEILDDGGVKLSFNETLKICRKFIKIYNNAQNALDHIYNKSSNNYQQSTLGKLQIERYKKIINEYNQWATYYELFLKHKRFKNDSK